MAQISIKIVSFFFFKNIDVFFYLAVAKMFLFQQSKLIIDIAERKEVLIVLGVVFGFGLNIIYRLRNLEKQNIEIKRQKIDLEFREEELRSKKLENDRIEIENKKSTQL